LPPMTSFKFGVEVKVGDERGAGSRSVILRLLGVRSGCRDARCQMTVRSDEGGVGEGIASPYRCH
jgi:hypothetical protein